MRLFLLVALLITVLSISVYAATNSEDELHRKVKPYLNMLVQKNTLEYKDPCHPAYEELRINQSRVLIDLLSRASVYKAEALESRVIQAITTMATVLNNYCNAFKNLECNFKGQCDCGRSEGFSGFKTNLERVGDFCLIATGSMCLPTDEVHPIELINDKNSYLLTGIPNSNFQCASVNGCVLKSNLTRPCSSKAIEETILQAAKDQGLPQLTASFRLKMVQDSICVCKGTSTFASVILVFNFALILVLKLIL